MNNLLKQLQNRFNNGTIVEKLIYINLGVFVAMYLLNTFTFLVGTQGNFFFKWFSLPANFDSFLYRPWSIISYGFVHAGFLHILGNLIILYYIGNLFIDYFTQKQLLNFYIAGTFFGGVLYLLSYNYFPALKGTESTLVGASAGVTAIFVGIASYMPNYELKLRFIGFVKLWVLAAIFVAYDLIQIPTGNTGGHISHLGGALFGYFYMSQIGHNTVSIKNFFDKIIKKKSPLKTVYKSNKKKGTSQPTNQQQVDRILEKISKSGYESLSQSEKDLLFKQGKK